MPIIVKPISAQLNKDGDFFGKAVTLSDKLGSLLCGDDRSRKTKDLKK